MLPAATILTDPSVADARLGAAGVHSPLTAVATTSFPSVIRPARSMLWTKILTATGASSSARRLARSMEADNESSTTDAPARRARRSLFYLLSNNHVNDMIMFDFRLEDEEVLSHFASFLKTLSLRLNEKTVQVRERSTDLPIVRARAFAKLRSFRRAHSQVTFQLVR